MELESLEPPTLAELLLSPSAKPRRGRLASLIDALSRRLRLEEPPTAQGRSSSRSDRLGVSERRRQALRGSARTGVLLQPAAVSTGGPCGRRVGRSVQSTGRNDHRTRTDSGAGGSDAMRRAVSRRTENARSEDGYPEAERTRPSSRWRLPSPAALERPHGAGPLKPDSVKSWHGAH